MTFPRLRTRQNGDSGPRSCTYRWQGDGFATIRSAGDWFSLGNYSYIADVVGTSKTQRVKPVLHQTARYVGLPMQPFVADNGLVVRFTDGLLPGLPFNGDLFGNAVLSVPHSVRVQASGRAFTSFAERFPPKISSAEFVQGLTQLKELLPQIGRSITQTIAGGYLTKKFGWDNLLSDLNTLSNLVASIRERMEFLKRTYGKPTKLYHREPNAHTLSSWSSLVELVRGFGLRYDLLSYRCDFVAGASLLQTLEHIDDVIGWIRAITISLGLNNPLKAIWQTTRLSFVVDWFVDVSAHLDRLATVQPAETWDVFNISSTVVWSARISVTQVNQNLLGGISNQECYLGFLDLKWYERLVGLPVDLTVFTPSTLTPNQLVLLLAMMGSK